MSRGLEVKVLTPKSFERYGRILCPTDEEMRGKEDQPVAYWVLDKASSEGWTMAYYAVSKRTTEIVECHPNTKETFEPISGVAILVVAVGETPEDLEAFLLDQPVVLNEGVWHDILALSAKTTMRINENVGVKGIRQELPFRVKAELSTEPLG